MNTLQSIDRAIGLLNLVSQHPKGIGIRDLARLSELTPPTVQKIVNSLREGHLLDTDPSTRRYLLGHGLVTLAEKASPILQFKRIAAVALDNISSATGETSVLLSWTREQFHLVDSRKSKASLTVSYPEPDTIVKDAEIWASGRAILAYLPQEQLDNWLSTRGLTKKVVKDLLQELAIIRDTGVAKISNANNNYIGAIAYPIFEADKSVRFALGCSAPLPRFDKNFQDLARQVITKAAESLSSLHSFNRP